MRTLVAGVCLVALGVSAGSAQAGSAGSAQAGSAHTRSPAVAGTTTSAQTTLTGDGLLGVTFGTLAFTIEGRAARLLGGRPRITISASTICGLSEQMHWTQGLTLDFHTGRFIGYELGPTTDARLIKLSTAAGLRLGDTTATARRLYGGRLTTSTAQDGSFSIRTPQGRIAGFLAHAGANGHPHPSGLVETIGAGDEGCPALSP